MSQSPKPSWMNEEESRADDLTTKGQVSNDQAPKMVKVLREPPRKQKAFYIQDKYADAFDLLVFNQKKSKGKKAPALAEEAIALLLKEYGQEL